MVTAIVHFGVQQKKLPCVTVAAQARGSGEGRDIIEPGPWCDNAEFMSNPNIVPEQSSEFLE